MNRDELRDAMIAAIGRCHAPAVLAEALLVLADEYAAHMIDVHARPPVPKQRRGSGKTDAQRAWREAQA